MPAKLTPNAAYIQHNLQIQRTLARLQALNDHALESNLNDIHWGHVGESERLATMLKEVSDIAFREGEYAPHG